MEKREQRAKCKMASQLFLRKSINIKWIPTTIFPYHLFLSVYVWTIATHPISLELSIKYEIIKSELCSRTAAETSGNGRKGGGGGGT